VEKGIFLAAFGGSRGNGDPFLTSLGIGRGHECECVGAGEVSFDFRTNEWVVLVLLVQF